MTYRDDPVMPSCPTCGLNDLASRDTFGQKHKVAAYLCGRCWSVFDGSQTEWAHHRADRELFQKRQENRASHS